MPFEIERRYIIQDDGWKVLTKEMKEFHQAYLSTNFDEWVIRTRIINNKESEITLKKSSVSALSMNNGVAEVSQQIARMS